MPAAAQRFWRTPPDDVTIEEAQVRLDTWCARRGDARTRSTPTGKTTVGALAVAEPLEPVPAPFPATLVVERTISAQALVSFRCNQYSVPPELTGAKVTVALRLGSTTIDIRTTPGPTVGARGGIVMARHRLATTGAGAMTLLVAEFRRLDLVDEYRLYVHLVLVGRRRQFLGLAHTLSPLRPIETRTFGNGVVMLRHEHTRDTTTP